MIKHTNAPPPTVLHDTLIIKLRKQADGNRNKANEMKCNVLW